MKRAIIYSIFCGSLLLNSCSSGFLDQDMPLYETGADIFSDVDRIEATLNGLYGAIKNTGYESTLGGVTYLAIDNRGDDFVNVSGATNSQTLANVNKMTVGAADAENENTWANLYLTINQTNIFLEDLAASKEVAGEQYEQFRQEALFVRALAYYYLNNLYAIPYCINPEAESVPLRLIGERDTGNNSMMRETVGNIYRQILADLSDISDLATGNNSYETTTHATQASANMLKMRVYMSLGEWDNAIITGEAIEGYILPDDVTAIYKSPYYTEETIFSLPMDVNNVPNLLQSLAEYYAQGYMLIETEDYGIMAKANYSLDIDKRVKNFKGENDLLLKFTDLKTRLQWVPIFRYAETLLNLAECYANKTSGEAKAKELLKRVRHRSITAESDPLEVDNLFGNSLKEAIYNERRLEFIGEGIRGIDIIRRGEHFIKNLGAETIDVGPGDKGYIWPIPQSEELINK